MAEEKTSETKSEGTQAVSTENKENYEAKYKELQSKYESTHTELKRVQETLDAVTPYVNWDLGQNQQPEEDGYVSKKDISSQLKSISESSENKILELQFQVNHPELKGYEDTLVAPTLIKLRRKYPAMQKTELLEAAAKEVTDFIEAERKKGEARIKAEKAKKDAESMSGLESSGPTTPNEVDSGQTREEYVQERKKALNKRKGYE